jgi:predicted Rossmann fold flavoprotein
VLQTDVLIIGAGAAGLMCAATAAARGRRVLVLDHANKAGKKILMSGGGRCNFTNLYCEAANFLSGNPHFCKSALARFTQWDFIGLVSKHGVPYHEKKLGQLFCDNKSSDILELLLAECAEAGAEIRLNTAVHGIEKVVGGFHLNSRWPGSSVTNCCRPAPGWCPSPSPNRSSRRCARSFPAPRWRIAG